jgi:hypothetical protein
MDETHGLECSSQIVSIELGLGVITMFAAALSNNEATNIQSNDVEM